MTPNRAFRFGTAAGSIWGLPDGPEIALAGAVSLGLYRAILGLAAGAICFTPGSATLGAVIGATPMLLLVAFIFLIRAVNGAPDNSDKPMFWVLVGILVSIPASLGAGTVACGRLCWEAARQSRWGPDGPGHRR